MHINKHDGDDKDNDEVEANDINAATWIRIGTSSFRSSISLLAFVKDSVILLHFQQWTFALRNRKLFHCFWQHYKVKRLFSTKSIRFSESYQKCFKTSISIDVNLQVNFINSF